VAVVDLDDVELLHDAAVQAHLLSFELGKHHFAKVNCHQREQLFLSLQISLALLNGILNFVHVSRILEESSDCLFARLDVVDVGLGRLNLSFEGVDGRGDVPEFDDGAGERAQIVDLSLDPVVEIGEGISQVFDRVTQALDQVALLVVV